MGGERGGRSTPRLIADTFGLYRRYPLLFVVLAAAVIVPEELITLAVTGSAGGKDSDALTLNIISLVDLLLVLPLVSALHVHGVDDIRRGEEPRLGSIAKRGAAALPVVCAATIMSSLGIFGGVLLFVIPGIYLWVRWYVVAQTAAIEREGWTAALRHSWALSEGSGTHVFVFLICITIIGAVPSVLLSLALGDSDLVSFLAGTALGILLVSFTALATALLYYDLRARREALAERYTAGADEDPEPASKPRQESNDPHAYSDSERPNGWYVDPDRPGRMLYWDDTDPPGWRGETRTPRKLRREWEAQGD